MDVLGIAFSEFTDAERMTEENHGRERNFRPGRRRGA
jgi:hypothetical protein